MKPEHSTLNITPQQISPDAHFQIASFSDLPISVIEDHICSRISTHEEFQSFTLVCKQFKQAAYQTYFYKHYILRLPNSGIFALFMSEPSLLISRYEKIDLSESVIDNQGLSLLSRKTRIVTDCRFTWCILLTPDAIISFLKNTAYLQSLNLDYCYDVNSDVLDCISQACPRLERLSLSHLNKITIESILNLLEKCSNMKELTLRATYNLNDMRIVDIFKKGKNLERVDLSHSSFVSNDILEQIVAAILENQQSHQKPFELILERNDLLKAEFVDSIQAENPTIYIRYSPLPLEINS
ncbi:MAG: hypothetical protein KBF71_03355 [Alphaproteobacteria bacterium]|nr:hypothetical protein [Alphaproteobacteria bacterium]